MSMFGPAAIVKFVGEHKSRWGYHACPYSHSQKLKRLAFLCLRHRQKSLAYWRWFRKQPQNRVIREKVRDLEGRVVGCKVIGPSPSPFQPQNWDSAARPEAQYKYSRVKEFEKRVRTEYNNARTPSKTPDMVPILTINPPDLDSYIARYESYLSK